MSMIANIVLYRFTGDFVSNRSDKISIFPEFSTPQLSLHFRVSQKDFFRTHALENPHHLPHRIFGWYAGKYMDMVLSYFHFLYFTVSRCQYLLEQLLCTISYLCFQYPLAIFGCPHKMVSRVIDCMAHSFDGHAWYYTKSLNKGNPFLPVLPHGVSRVSFS
jgi:hypothetical protein